MLPTSPHRSSASGTSTSFTLNPLQNSPEIPLPVRQTVETLQVVSGTKRKQATFVQESGSKEKLIKTEREPAALSTSASMPLSVKRPDQYQTNPKRWVSVIIRNNARLNLAQMGEKIRVLGNSLGGRAMSAEIRDVLMTQILNAHATYGELQMGNLIYGLGWALGGRAMTTENRNALMTHILGVRGACSNEQIGQMVMGLGTALGGRAMSAQHRSALVSQILEVSGPGNGTLKDCLIRGVGLALGGPAMTAQNRDALMTQILGAHATCSEDQIAEMICGAAVALGGSVMTAENRNALMTQIIGAHAAISGEQMSSLIRAVGNAVGGPAMTTENRPGLMNQILGAHATCSAQQMRDMVRGLWDALGGPVMSAQHRNALLLQVLDAHRTCSSLQIGVMYCQLCTGTQSGQVLNDNLLAGLSPIKTGMLVGATVAISCQTVEQKEQCREFLGKSLTDCGLVQTHGSFVDAGVMAACGDLSGILGIEGLQDGEKLNFIDFSCGVVSPIDQVMMPFQLGKIMFLDQPTRLKAQTLSTLLSHGPYNPSWVASVRHWLIGTLAEIPKIQWIKTKVRTKEEVTIEGDSAESAKEDVTVECDSAAFADWYGCIKEFYHGVVKHMTDQCIEKEKILISSHPMLPSDVQKTIFAVLKARQAELTVTLQ